METRAIKPSDFEDVAHLIRSSTNAWYKANRGIEEMFSGTGEDCLVIPEVYNDIDPGKGLVAIANDGALIGSCFVHPRETHIGIGIVNSDPDAIERGAASRLMDEAVKISERLGIPLRLISSAMNLDSFSLYSRKGFRPIEFYQDMKVSVPEGGFPLPDSDDKLVVRPATKKDASTIANLEETISGIRRPNDFAYMIENTRSLWSASVVCVGGPSGEIVGFLGSVASATTNMLGPGFARDEDAARILLTGVLNLFAGSDQYFLIPSRFTSLVSHAYELKARNSELHILQVRGEGETPNGVTFPTFLPETG